MDNIIGAPHIIMSFISGHTVQSMWWNKAGPTSLEERRLKILDTIAEAMAQLSSLKFSKIGSLQFRPGKEIGHIEIGPCYDDGSEDLQPFGPFTSSETYLWSLFKRSDQEDTTLAIGAEIILKKSILYLHQQAGGDQFVIAHPG
jgi:hypothetical protein